jgi:hypothetical protein
MVDLHSASKHGGRIMNVNYKETKRSVLKIEVYNNS